MDWLPVRAVLDRTGLDGAGAFMETARVKLPRPEPETTVTMRLLESENGPYKGKVFEGEKRRSQIAALKKKEAKPGLSPSNMCS